MTRSIFPRALAALVVAAAFLGLGAGPVAADCAESPPIEEAVTRGGSIFVGRVEVVTNGDRWAAVAVEDIWVGPDLPSVVEVRGGADPNLISSIDRTYQSGVTYLFFVEPVEGTLHDSSCSSTTEWEPRFLDLRPASAHPPIGAPAEQVAESVDVVPILGPVGLAALVGLVVFGGAVLLRRRPA